MRQSEVILAASEAKVELWDLVLWLMETQVRNNVLLVNNNDL